MALNVYTVAWDHMAMGKLARSFAATIFPRAATVPGRLWANDL